MRNVIFLAPPAAGKGTFSEFLIQNYNYQYISTGNILRDKAKENSEEGKWLKEFLATGALLSDEKIFDLMESELSKLDSSRPFILDGVPRTMNQVDYLEGALSDKEFIVVEISVEKDILEKRITGRYNCPTCKRVYNIHFEDKQPLIDNTCDKCNVSLYQRDDDNMRAFQVRYQNYLKATNPIKEYYNSKGLLKSLNNSGSSLVETYSRLTEMLGE